MFCQHNPHEDCFQICLFFSQVIKLYVGSAYWKESMEKLRYVQDKPYCASKGKPLLCHKTFSENFGEEWTIGYLKFHMLLKRPEVNIT